MRRNVHSSAWDRLEIFALLRARYPDAPKMRRHFSFAIGPEIDFFIKDMLGDYAYVASLQLLPGQEESNAKP